MRFSTPLVPGRLIRRYMRFLADVELDDGRVVKAHCPNPGSMLGLKEPGLRVWLEGNDDPKKKLDWGWRLVEVPGAIVGIDTGAANAIVAEYLRSGCPTFDGYTQIRAEVKYRSNSRVDFLMTGADLPDCYVEVKSVTLSRQAGIAEFPDSVTARGAKHLSDLSVMIQDGHRSVLIYLIQRVDCDRVAIAADLDPTYAEAFKAARSVGLEVIGLACEVMPEQIVVSHEIPLV